MANEAHTMVEPTISRPFIGSPSPQPWSHRVATKLFYTCQRWQLAGKGSLQEQQQQHPTVVDATRPHNSGGPASPPIRLVCISDTHNAKPAAQLPHGDILLHAGDLSQYGTFDEIQAQLDWLNSQPHQHKIIIAGNHDLLLDPAFVQSHPDRELDRHPGKRRADLDWGDVRYLQQSSVSVVVAVRARRVRVFGSPWTPRMGSWAFQYESRPDSLSSSSCCWKGGTVPADADVVLVHGPPAGHVDDGGKGCPDLLAELWRARPRVVVCGHIHAGRGHQLLAFDRVQRYYEGVVVRGRGNWMSSSLLLLGICTAWRWVLMHMGRAASGEGGGGTLSDTGTWLVNASITGGHGKAQQWDPYVVLL